MKSYGHSTTDKVVSENSAARLARTRRDVVVAKAMALRASARALQCRIGVADTLADGKRRTASECFAAAVEALKAGRS